VGAIEQMLQQNNTLAAATIGVPIRTSFPFNDLSFLNDEFTHKNACSVISTRFP